MEELAVVIPVLIGNGVVSPIQGIEDNKEQEISTNFTNISSDNYVTTCCLSTDEAGTITSAKHWIA
jgi:hypothetical protein